MIFSNKLVIWYGNNQRNFPWRETKNPYKVWLSEIILQQTKTAQGLPYYINFTKKYPKIEDLSCANETDVLKLWQGLGYYSRARNLHYTARQIHNNFQGQFPNNYKDLLKLKGVGDYTASAIASICFNEKCAVVDGNVYRVLSRYFGIELPINSTQGIKKFKYLAQKLLPKNNFGNYNQAIMDFGATICTPKKTKCTICIFNDSCYALQNNKVTELPIKTKKNNIKKRYFNYFIVLLPKNKISLLKRTNKDIWQHLFEFPLIESSNTISLDEITDNKEFKNLFNKQNIKKIHLFNNKPIIHKLSHQHIYANFWIVDYQHYFSNAIEIKNLKNYPVSTLINNFIKVFAL